MEELRHRVRAKGWKVAQKHWDDCHEYMVEQGAMAWGVGRTWHVALQKVYWRRKEDAKLAWWA